VAKPGAPSGGQAAPAGGGAPGASAGSAASASAGQVQAGPLGDLIAGARREGQLNLVWGAGTMGGADGIRRLRDGFNKAYGLNLEVNFTPGPSMPEMATKTLQEFQAGRPATSDVVAGYSVHMHTLMKGGAAELVDWTSWAPNIRSAEQVAPDGAAVAFETSFPVITYNSQRVSGDLVPRTLQDLLKPQYKGRVASTPYAANFDYLATDDVWGPQRTFDFLTQFVPQIAGLIRCNETERLASGEFDLLALDCSQSNALSARAEGQPISFVVPSDVALIIPLYVAVPKNARHPNAAKLWINYLLGREGQDVLYELDHTDSHLVPGSKTAKELEASLSAGARFTVADVGFVQRQDEQEYSRRRARAQEILLQR
jgi:ABC-type Fe3+ transport system substrate-binding protein